MHIMINYLFTKLELCLFTVPPSPHQQASIKLTDMQQTLTEAGKIEHLSV